VSWLPVSAASRLLPVRYHPVSYRHQNFIELSFVVEAAIYNTT